MLTDAFRFTHELAGVWLAPAVLMVIASVVLQHHAPYKRKRLYTVGVLLLCAYVIGAGLLMLWPLDQLRVSDEALRQGNWLPLRGSLGYFFSGDPIRTYLGQADVLSHVLLFAPIGLLLPYIFAGHRGVAVVAIVAIVVFGIEFAQGLLVRDRVFDIDQVIAGSVGALAASVASNLLYLSGQLGRLATR